MQMLSLGVSHPEIPGPSPDRPSGAKNVAGVKPQRVNARRVNLEANGSAIAVITSAGCGWLFWVDIDNAGLALALRLQPALAKRAAIPKLALVLAHLPG
ncbi:MAG: hypothetical protein KGQ52_06410 [Alphaproteobacteria bacterium]|nr:hypothetical protein [Alphaproteobacteria bacterium]